MESATAPIPPRIGLNCVLLSAEINIPEGQEFENILKDFRDAPPAKMQIIIKM